MRISKQLLVRRWAITTILAAVVLAVLAWSDLRLKALSGYGTADLQGYATATQYGRAFMAWWPALYAVRAGFNWGLDYLLMPLYAAAFYYSGILTREAFAPRPGRPRRLLTLLAAVPTVLVALARTVGWISQWKEMIEEPQRKIGRPRQLYTGAAQRDYVPVDQRG